MNDPWWVDGPRDDPRKEHSCAHPRLEKERGGFDGDGGWDWKVWCVDCEAEWFTSGSALEPDMGMADCMDYGRCPYACEYSEEDEAGYEGGPHVWLCC